jgi:hypothetical protein
MQQFQTTHHLHGGTAVGERVHPGLVPSPVLAIALGAVMSCWDAPAPPLRSFNGSRRDKSSGVAASGVAALACGRESGAALSSTQKRLT